jgi:hypothetical protein
MSGPGYVFKDGGIIPDDELQQQAASTEHTPDAGREPVRPAESSAAGSPISTPNSSKSGLPSNAPTESHALAEASHEEKGAAQEAHNEMEVKDLGWNEHPKDIPKPLVGGLPNSELWLLVRRFNKVSRPLQPFLLILTSHSKCTMLRQLPPPRWAAST